MDTIILRGDICFTPDKDHLETHPDSYLVFENGICRGIFSKLPEKYACINVKDYKGHLIMPGMVDLHVHAPQFAFRGMGMDYELLTWLKKRTFPEEAKYADTEYAALAYGMFADQMKKSATTHAVIFGTIHREATLMLMDMMENTGLTSYVGKVNMDRDAPVELLESGAREGAADTISFINESQRRGYKRTKPILTPRFIPCCTDELLRELSKVRIQYDLPVQSHLSENPGEVELVKKLIPQAKFYADAYDRFGLFGKQAKTVMAHCVYSTGEEIERIKENGVWIAHCPSSNVNLSSGIAPVRKYIENGIRMGLGSDVAGGQTESIFRAITDTIGVSKLYWRYIDADAKPITFSESFYLATKGGGSFFGKVGSFEEGYEMSVVVLDDSVIPHPQQLSLEERVERSVYLGVDVQGIRAKLCI